MGHSRIEWFPTLLSVRRHVYSSMRHTHSVPGNMCLPTACLQHMLPRACSMPAAVSNYFICMHARWQASRRVVGSIPGI